MIYLDYAASTPPYDTVYPCMTQVATDVFGNPSSRHAAGTAARRWLRQSRLTVAQLLGVQPQEIIFTSGGTESNNTALFSLQNSPRKHIVIAATEHSSVLRAADRLERQGFSVSRVLPDPQGRILPQDIAQVLRRDTALLSVHAVNNETGVIQDIAAMAQLAHGVGAFFHCDAVQSFGHAALPLHCADLLSLSGHKFGGPRGIGVLMVKEGILGSPLLVGGHQELTRRAGTENLPGIAGFALAAERVCLELSAEAIRQEKLAALLLSLLRQSVPDLVLHSHSAPRVPGLLSLRFPGASGEEMQIRLNEVGICVGVGAACSSADAAPSHVLTAMGLTPKQAGQTLRVSLGRLTTEEDIRAAANAMITVYELCKKQDP